MTDSHALDHYTVDVQSNRIAAELVAHGIQKGDRVALYCPNLPEFVLAYLGIIKAGAIVVPINLLVNIEEVAHILTDSGAKACIVHHTLLSMAERAQSYTSKRVLTVVIGSSACKNALPFDDFLCSEAPVPDPVLDSYQDIAAILYTSGTTGFPKGAMLTHANLVANTESVKQAMAWRPGEDIVLVVLPMFHAFAATVGMLTPLICGCALVPMTKFDPDLVADTIHAHRATVFLGVPSMYSVLLRLKENKIPSFASLRCCVAGGAALPVEVFHRFEAKYGVRVYEGDGPTECSPVTCVNPVGGLAKPGTVGLPVPGVEMNIVDDEGNQLPDGQVGEVVVRGDNVMKGYWNRPEETAAVFRNGWFLTGDLGVRDEDGYFSLVDRKKDLIIVNGMNVYPRMIEEVLYRLEGLREVAVVGEPNERHGEVPVAYISVHSSCVITESELRAHCLEYLGRHQVPKRFEILSELPKNATGKIMKRQLRKHGEVERGVVLRED